jgi:hypothetical protein
MKYDVLDAAVTKSLYESGEYGASYLNLSYSFAEGTDERVWFQNAALINAGIGPGSEFARVQTAQAFAIAGKPTPSAQDISDGIARSVLGTLVARGTNSISVDEIHVHEGRVVVDDFGLPRHLWTFSGLAVAYYMGTTKYIEAEGFVEKTQLVVTNAISAIVAAGNLLGSELPKSTSGKIPWLGTPLD